MNTNFKTTFRAAFATLLCLSAITASAQIQVIGIYTYADTADGDTILTSETEESIFIDVEFDEMIFDFTASTTLRPTLSFTIGSMAKTAEFAALSYGNFMTFRYFPTAGDYGTGLKIKDTFYPSARILINMPAGLTIRNVSGTKTLPIANQYDQIVATTANADPYNQAIGINLFKIENGNGTGISINRGDSQTITIHRPAIAADNTTNIRLIGVSTNSAVATVAPSPQTLNGGNASCNFIITGGAPGNTMVRIFSQDHPSEFVEIPVTVTLSGNEKAITFDPPELIVPENASSPRQWVRVSVGFPPKSDLTLNVTKTGLNANWLICPTTLTIPANSTSAYFPIETPDGDVDAILTFSDPMGVYNTVNFTVCVDNVKPTIVRPFPTLSPEGLLIAEITTVVGETLTLTAEVSDPAGTNDVISYSWDHEINGVTTVFYGQSVEFVFDKDTTVVLRAIDEDGGSADPVYIAVECLPLTSPLRIDAIDVIAVTVSEGPELISELNEKLFINVFFDDFLHDFASDPNDTGSRPKFEFRLGGQVRTAEFDSIDGKKMVFTYSPKPTDYGLGFTIANTLDASPRRVIALNGAQITNIEGLRKLKQSGQYEQAFAMAFNSDAHNQSIRLNMYRLDTDIVEVLAVDCGEIVPVTICRPVFADGNSTSIALIGTSTKNAVATISPSVQTLVGGSLVTTFFVEGMTPGTATLRVFSQAHPDEFVEIIVTVGNAVPRIISAVSDATSVAPGGGLVFFGAADHPSNKAMTYVWSFSDGSTSLDGAVVKKTFYSLGVVTVTLTVSDSDGGSDSTQIDIRVQEPETVSIVFTAISTQAVSFQIPTTAKSRDFQVEVAPALPSDRGCVNTIWTPWLKIAATDLIAGGSFSADMLIAPLTPVEVVSTDNADGTTSVTFDTTSLYATEARLFFRVSLQNEPL